MVSNFLFPKGHTLPLSSSATEMQVIADLPNDISDSWAAQLLCSLPSPELILDALTGCCQCLKSEFEVSGCSRGNAWVLITLRMTGY